MLTKLVKALPNDWRHIELPWSASYGPVNAGHDWQGASFREALEGGYRLLDQALSTLDDEDVVLAGYSGGAALIGNYLAYHGTGMLNLAAAALVADPFDPGNDDSYGIAGRRKIENVADGRIIWKANPKDVICCCPADSPLRRLADVSTPMSLGDPNGWVSALANLQKTNGWQKVPFTPSGRRYSKAVNDALGYLGLGRKCEHTVYGSERLPWGWTYLEDAADYLEQTVAEKAATTVPR